MDVYDLRNRYDISVKKLRRMERDGVLRTGKSLAPKYWQTTRTDIRKGKMCARSIALAYRYPDKLESFMLLTAADRRVIERHILSAEIPPFFPPVASTPSIPTIIWGADTKEEGFVGRFVSILQSIIPDRPVGYLFVAVRMLLMCEKDFQIDMAAKSIQRALLNARDDPAMQGWSYREPTGQGKFRTIFKRPTSFFDL